MVYGHTSPRTTRHYAGIGLCFISMSLASCASPPQRGTDPSDRFFSAWAAPHGRLAEQAPSLNDSTVRIVVRPTVAGTSVRIKLENTIAKTPVTFNAAYIGVLDRDAAVVAGTNRPLTFAGKSTLTLAAGAGTYSDAVDFPVRAFEQLAISLEVASAAEISSATMERDARVIARVQARGI
jgi:hypothetical protein